MARDLVALVPMKAHSLRVPDKNGREFNGMPLFDWLLATRDRTSVIDGFTAAVFEAADRLEMVVNRVIGTDSIDSDAAERTDVMARNTPGVFAPGVAEVVTGCAAMLTRGLHLVDREVRRGSWRCPGDTSLPGKTSGVVGVGNDGSETARRADAHGMEVVGYDVGPIDDDLKADVGICSLELEEPFTRADIESRHCPLTPETAHMVGKAELAAFGPEGYLINTARGRVVARDALVDAPDDGTVAGAAPDVFEEVPHPPTSPLADMDTAVRESHTAQNTAEAVEAVNERTVPALLDLLPT